MSDSLIIFIPNLTSRHQYIFKLVFNDIYKVDYELTDNIDYYINSNKNKINYSDTTILETEFFIQAHGLLDQKGVSEIEIIITQGNIPFFFASNSEESYPFDIFSASFYLVTRYEEYLPHLKDNYNRYKAEESLAYRYGFLDKPIVNIWLKDFIHSIKSRFSSLFVVSPKFKYISTIDIDTAFLYKAKGFVRSIAFLFKALWSFDIKSLQFAFLVIAKKRKDPFDTYSLQINLQKKYNIDVRYFILLADYGLNDKNISHNNMSFQTLIKGLADLAPVGIHPSFGSNINQGKLFLEIKRLENIQKRETSFSRQHFLQLSLPETYVRLCDAGITDDFTMGYSNQLGFRAGIATKFLFYNLDTEQMLPITIHPFSISDTVLRYSLGLRPDNSIERIQAIIDEVKRIDGTLITVWHNDTFSNIGDWKGWKNIYEDMIKQIQM